MQTITVQQGETLFDIARRFDLGLLEVKEANPNIKGNKVIAGQQIILPTSFILPHLPKQGIILNLAEMRIYFFQPEFNSVSTYPVGIGRYGWRTPVGATKIVKKRQHPSWRPPASIRAHYKRKGKILPTVMPPGPNNPLGDYAMNLAWPRYIIHGTNQPTSVGLRSSSGCIRMYPEDIEALYHQTPVGTQVIIIHQPFKIGQSNGELYLEAHEPFLEKYYGGDDRDALLQDALGNNPYKLLRWPTATEEIKNTMGYPILLQAL